MNKIPLETTLAGAYRFLFTRIPSIVGTLWLPFLATAVMMGAVVWFAVPHAWLAGNFPQLDENVTPRQALEVVVPFLKAVPLIIVISLVMGAMMFVGLMRLALGRTKRCFAFFSLGGDVWRLVLAFLLMGLLIVLLEIVLIGVFAGALAAAKALLPKTAAMLCLVVLGIAEACFLIYAVVRWQFFLPAVVVAEHRIGLGRSWELGGGNFWRIVVIFLLIVIPVGFVAGIVWQMTLMPVVISEAMRLPDNPGPAEISHFFRALLPLVPVFLIVYLVQQVATMGLMAGAIGTAYKAVNPPHEEETPPA